MTNYNKPTEFVPNVKIGKGSAVKNKKSKEGKPYDRIDGYILHPDTGQKLGLLIFISDKQASYINPKTKQTVLKKDKDGLPQYEVSILLKGVFNESSKRYEKLDTKFIMETKQKVKEVENPELNDDIGF